MRTVPSTGLYVVEWSKSQNAIHIQELERSVQTARNHFRADEAPNDYVVIYVGTQEDCDQLAVKMIRPVLCEREQVQA